MLIDLAIQLYNCNIKSHVLTGIYLASQQATGANLALADKLASWMDGYTQRMLFYVPPGHAIHC